MDETSSLWNFCVDRSTAISTQVRLFRLFLLIPCWESQRLIPKRSAGPRATKIGVVSLKALDHHRPNREESPYLGVDFIYLFRKLDQKPPYMLQWVMSVLQTGKTRLVATE